LSTQTSGVGPLFTITSVNMLIYFFIKNLFAGPFGEELGWRGFVQTELQKKYSPLRAALIVGFWWGIWHLPIWFTTGFMGVELVKYIVFFMISVLSISIVMAACYNLNKNLLIPIIIHQFFNFLLGMISGNLIDIIGYTAILYAMVALTFIVVNPKKVLYGTKQV
ncbi:MAG: lysostaphin resistance A-like protein, partial [Turicibacter sp.]